MSSSLKNILSFHATSRIARSFLTLWHTSGSRRFVSRKDCAPNDGPRCAKERLEKLPPCPAKLRKMEANEHLPNSNSMWENPECCTDPCPDYFPRFDEIYYKSSNKMERKYQQTWIGCPKLQIKPKVLCSFEQYKFPPLEKRPRQERPQTACPQAGPKICMDSKSKKCPRLKMPMCQGVRSPPKCKRERSPTDCKKECSPYPSYSECLRSNADPAPPIECKCLNHPMMCEVWAEMRRRMTFKQ